MSKKGTYRTLKVAETYKLNSHLQRIRFTGEDLHDFPTGEEGAYVKVILGVSKAELEQSGKRPKMRSYTVADFDEKNHVLTLDFMIGHHKGFTSQWAESSKVGDEILIAGPGPRKIYDFPKTDYLLFGDLTSINAVFAYLKLAPKEATGEAYIAIPHQDDRIEINYDNQIKLHWIDSTQTSYFVEKIEEYEGLSESTVVFGAGEADEIKLVRNFLKEKFQGTLENHYLSGYWKRNRTDEEYREEKKKLAGN